MTEAPFNWPEGWPRTPDHQRRRGKFTYQGSEEYPRGSGQWRKVTRSLTRAKATERVTDEIRRMGGTGTRVDVHEAVRRDGQSRAESQQPKVRDPGAVVSFRLGNRPIVFPCDRYTTPEDNLAAIAATLEAKRVIERHGVSTLEREFQGYVALPAGAPAAPAIEADPRFVDAKRDLEGAAGVSAVTFQLVRRSILKRFHPDTQGTGDAEIFKALQPVIEALEKLGAGHV